MANVLVGRRVMQSKQLPVGTAALFNVAAGELIQIVDMAGAQVASLVAWGGTERLSTPVTVSANASIVLKKGDKLYGSNKTELLELVEDTVGRHDLLTGTLPTPAPTSTVQTVVTSNQEALKAAAANAPDDDVSNPVNFFKHVTIKGKGELDCKESFSERNDTVVLVALTNTTVIIGNQYHERKPGVTAGKTAMEKDGVVLVRVYA
ncbi:MAG: urea carboxylase-associated family protein [Thermomicrobiales bacterium]|nr:urea carboxylase-associated family protein [Thermomicrobiales bacterium]MCO5228810.1 urea carboxylase-associated family protein [Thermomicrobiales bacterium]